MLRPAPCPPQGTNSAPDTLYVILSLTPGPAHTWVPALQVALPSHPRKCIGPEAPFGGFRFPPIQGPRAHPEQRQHLRLPSPISGPFDAGRKLLTESSPRSSLHRGFLALTRPHPGLEKLLELQSPGTPTASEPSQSWRACFPTLLRPARLPTASPAGPVRKRGL